MDHTTLGTPNQQARTLIVLHGNRYIEVFGSDRHPVKIVNVPDMRSIAGEILIEELLTLRLSPFWSKVYRDGYLIDRDAIRNMSVSDLVVRDHDNDLLKAMNSVIGSNEKHEAGQWRTVLV